jgi:thiamine biosynthesis lipoprotein
MAAARRDRAPDEGELAEVLARVGSDKIRVEGEVVDLARPGMRIDLGAVAKGWALDRMRELLEREGVRHALLNFGQSSLLALGRPVDAPSWSVALRGGGGEIEGLVELREQAFSVSGTLGQWSSIGGVRYGHVIDPRTGRALTRNLQAAVVAPSAALAEVWSTALTVLGPEGLRLVESEPGVEALLREEGGATTATRGWDAAVAFEPLR